MQQKQLKDVLGNLFPYFEEKYRSITDYSPDTFFMPASTKEKWACACGCENDIKEKTCNQCGITIQELATIISKKTLIPLKNADTDHSIAVPKKPTPKVEVVKEVVEVKDLYKCPKCGASISDDDNYCRKCGKKLISGGKPVFLQPKVLICAIAVIAVVLGVGGFFVYKNVIAPGNKYSNAVEMASAGDYDGAISSFQELGDYKDSKEKVKECYYNKAEKLFESGSYSDAIGFYGKAGDYGNASARISDANRQIEKEEAEEKQKKEEEEKETELQSRIDDLKLAYDSCSSKRTTLSNDGKSIFVDSKDENDSKALADIVSIIYSLNLPDSLVQDIDHTNALMGKQEKKYDKYSVEWSYHPDNGLDIAFYVNDVD